jgi:hypothetical protein
MHCPHAVFVPTLHSLFIDAPSWQTLVQQSHDMETPRGPPGAVCVRVPHVTTAAEENIHMQMI